MSLHSPHAYTSTPTQVRGGPLIQNTAPQPPRYRRSDFEPYAHFPEAAIRSHVDRVCAADRSHDAAVGAMVGMAVADAVGAPLEFLPAVDTPFSSGHGFKVSSLKYTREMNRFSLKRGQWTDDAAMGHAHFWC